MFPLIRTRRYRQADWMRNLIADTDLLPKNLIMPFFVIEGKQKKEPILSMPSIYRLSIDLLTKEVLLAQTLGIKSIALFPVIDSALKNSEASEAFNRDNLISRAIKAIKNTVPDMGIICDVALDPYTNHGHDGIVIDDDVDNDKTIERLGIQALCLAKAGADIIAPSDMMDGRIGYIRKNMEENGFHNIGILSYAMKYASSFYGPFRDAIGTKQLQKNFSKKTYQADYRSSPNEAILEAHLDEQEGADFLMVKPAGYYLDIISKIKDSSLLPVFAYQVSGEYAMLKYAALNGALDWEAVIIESLISIKRAGASAIFTYAAIEVANILNNR